jgi:hypothetical protein
VTTGAAAAGRPGGHLDAAGRLPLRTVSQAMMMMPGAMLRSYVRAATSSRRFQLFLVAHSLDKVARQRARAAAAAGAAAACLGAACLGAGTAAGSHICSARVGAARPIQSVLAHLRCGA